MSHTPSTRYRYQGIVDKHIVGRWESVTIGAVEFVDVQAWLTELAETQSTASVTRIHRVMSRILDLAVRDKRVPSNPAHKASLPRVAHKKGRYLTAAQVEELATKADSWGVLVLFLAYTGLPLPFPRRRSSGKAVAVEGGPRAVVRPGRHRRGLS
ncbi:hypothetical protein [Antrihabitans stalactiti]|uniref:hypothetical protein n=1 Tax=Antrihabitans stalactiti TaxID=2584121 RepID=UPI00146B651C|nr:hypothetical protein [Antrihabitans stalactiti]